MPMRALSLARLAAVCTGFLFFCATAAAQGTPQQRAACMDDAYRFCGSVIPDVRRIEACLQRKLAQLTAACRAQFAPPPASTRRTRRPPR
jgi:hypothetical protein